MTELVVRRADVRFMLWHLAAYGLADILHGSLSQADVRLGWTKGAQPRPWVGVEGLDPIDIAGHVRRHSDAHAQDDSWVSRDVELNGSRRGLMSPRTAIFPDTQVQQAVQRARHGELDRLTDVQAWLDLRFLAALGEPCYWSHNPKGDPLQDDGASRLEMQPRNQGAEFVGSRLRKLARSVAARTPAAVLAGLEGDTVHDEIGGDKKDSRTATGLAGIGPTDNAVAWCALWGIACLPLSYRINTTAITTGHLGRNPNEWFYLPYWTARWRPAKARSVLASRHLAVAASVGIDRLRAPADGDLLAAWAHLSSRGVEGVLRFPVARFGSASAPERRAMRGELVRMQPSSDT